MVSSADDFGDDTPGVLEIYDFLTRTWRAVPKTPIVGSTPRGSTLATTTGLLRRPGTARLVEEHAFVQVKL